MTRQRRRPFWAVSCIAAVAAVFGLAGAGPAPGAAAIPFQYVRYGILASVRVNGAGPYAFLIDTDTTPSAIDLGLARKLKLSMGASGAASGVGSDKVAVYPVKLSNVDLSGESASNVDALAIDLSGLSAHVGTRIDGVLGTSFLNGRVLQIDYACRTVSFPNGARAQGPTVPFRSDDGANVIDDAWVGSHKISATFDSGDGSEGFVTAAGIKELRLEDAARAGQSAVAMGYRGQEKVTMGDIADVRIGSVPLGSLKMRFFADQHVAYDLNIGNRALERFVVTVDYKRGLLTLGKPMPCSNASPAAR